MRVPLDFPDRWRGVPSPSKVNWEAMDFVVRTTEGSALQKDQFKRRFYKAIKKRGTQAIQPWFRYHYVAARLALGDFSDYWGWEFRSFGNEDEGDDWAARLYWEETWLPKWGGGGVERLLVLGEQGVGDMVFFASILPECLIRCREVIYECDERLHGMLQRSLPGLRVEKERRFEDRRQDYGKIDAFIPAAELMRMFRRSKSHFPKKPYLVADPGRVVEMEPYRGRVAVSWRGRQGAIDPMSLGLKNPISVQYSASHPEIPMPSIDLKEDLEGVLALLSVCSKLVTVPTTVMHLAGALGKKVQVICPDLPGEVISQVHWDYPPGRSNFYPDTFVYRNQGEWNAA